MAVTSARIVVRAQHGDVVAGRLRPTELQRVDLRAGMMPRQEIVDGVKNPEGGSHRNLIIGNARSTVTATRPGPWHSVCPPTAARRSPPTNCRFLRASPPGRRANSATT